MTLDISGSAYAYVFSFKLPLDINVDLSALNEIADDFAKEFKYSGRIELYTADDYFTFPPQFEQEKIRILRVGVALSTKGPKKRQKMMDYIQILLQSMNDNYSYAPELSEAITVGMARVELNSFKVVDFHDGALTSNN